MRKAAVSSWLHMVMTIKCIVGEHVAALSFLDIVINLEINFVILKIKSLEHTVNTWVPF